MGEVYRADDLTLGQPVALKFLPAGLGRDDERTARLLAEVRLARQVSHRNVCRVFDVAEADGRLFLSMEYIDGEDLGSLLRRIGRLPPDKALAIGRELAAGLAAIHSQGIVHRDLKPANLMIDGRGHARITDFGVAGLAKSDAGTDAGVGTPRYMAPEQLTGAPATAGSDLYAFGMVLYELLTGRRAFPQAGSLAELTGLRQTAPPSPSSLVAGIEPALERLVLHCLARDPAGRPPSAEAVAAALAGAESGVAPAESERAEDTIPGWRPAPGLELPARPHWEMAEKLGEGGFGEVWLAVHRKTGERRVFKFCYEEESLRALQREITLFRLLKEELGDRTDIARILDWNFDQAPYFVESEYTAGGNLVEWAEEQGGLAQVPLATRLELLAQVADALAAAHSVGVLHKDVKPGNVLVTVDSEMGPRVKLIDFGIGQITDRERLARAGITVLGMTATLGEMPSADAGTRLYMAPEVVEGKAATVEADIYALGVLLYQLVVGDFTRAVASGWRRDVDDELLCEDIAITVDGSPERRLGNARRLAERLRTLEERRRRREAERRERQAREQQLREAQLARGLLVRARKRRKLLALVIAGLSFFAAAMVLQARRVAHEAERANREAERANREARAAQQVSQFLVGLFERTDPFEAQDREITLQSILDQGAEKIEQELGDQPAVQARLMNTIGVVYHNLGQYETAERLIERALGLRRQVFGEQHVEVAESLNDLGWLLVFRGDYRQAEPLLRQALAMRRELLGEEHLEVAESLHNLGGVLYASGATAETEAVIRQALAIRRRLLGEEDFLVLKTQTGLAVLASNRGDYPQAEQLYRQVLARKQRQLSEDHPLVARVMNNLGNVLHALGRDQEAEQLHRKSMASWRSSVSDEHAELAIYMANLATVLHAQGEDAEAEGLYREALAMARRLEGVGHPEVAARLADLARFLIDRGDVRTARSLIGEALEIFRQALPEGHWRIAYAESVLGASLAGLGRYRQAEELLLAAYAGLRDGKGERTIQARYALQRIVALYEAWGQAEKAAEYRALIDETAPD